jgi:hypothetical protein
MSSSRAWLVVLATLSSVSNTACALAPKRPVPPPREVCFVGSTSCACYDSRFKEAPPGTFPISCDEEKALARAAGDGVCYLRPLHLCRGYNAYSPDDYSALQEWQARECRGSRDVTPAR